MASLNRGIGLSEAAEQRWRRHLSCPFPAPSAARSSGSIISDVIPTQQLLQDMTRNPNAPPLPASFQRWVDVPFEPPQGEDWHILDGFHVRMSRAEWDELQARAEASSDGGEEDEYSEADTSVGPGSDDGEDLEFALDSDEWTDGLGA
eukprot:TRINITY_DN5551_c0_g1_i1.p1 TRINITY_DN5551_c0_g1~~TRINITY_DN5551_c0_g1_i1.p1  ORF type:complete len:148 (-),score=22.84 TRINITY_DN5551_c0_g1_i1:332-775(-)